MLRTKPHHLYLAPTLREVQSHATLLGFKKGYSVTLIQDMINVMSFLYYMEPPESALIPLVPPPFYDDKPEKRKKWFDYHKQVQDFLCTLDYEKVSGNSPMTKAFAVLALLHNAKKKLSDKENKDLHQAAMEAGADKDESIPFPLFMDDDGHISSAKSDVLLEELTNACVAANTSVMRYDINPEAKLPEIALMDIDPEDQKILDHVAILEKNGRISAHKDPAQIKHQRMSSFDQVGKMTNMVDMLMPTFDYKFSTKQLNVRDVQQFNKQLLVFLVDNSGSMSSTEKRAWVKSILVNRLDAVRRNDAVLYIGWFENTLDVGHIVKISTPDEADEFYKKGFYGEFNGGNTNIQLAVETACTEIATGVFGGHVLHETIPQIVVVNDGQDHVDPLYKPTIVTHGFILGQDNKNMEKMTDNSGGSYKRFL